MKLARLVCTAAIVLGIAGGATAYACKDKQAAAAAANCPATASCPANSAKCAQAKASAAAAAMGECPYHKTAATTAAMEGGCSHHADAAAASAEGGCSHKTSFTAADFAACTGHAKGASAMGACNHEKGASAAGMSGCSGHNAAAMAEGGSCMHGSAAMAASMGGCPGHGMAMHADVDCQNCVSCTDMANCERELESVGAVIQVVRLKNGVMYVYTADGAAKVRAVQAALAKRGDEWGKLAVTASTEKLCPPCKEMRGAAASGKLNRETVNIEGGVLSLMTSNDPGVVKKIYAMAGIPAGARVKS